MATKASQSAQAMRERLEVVRELIGIFKFERVVYMTITVVAFIALLASAIAVLFREKADWTQFSLLFGSAGAISYTCARLLRMWSDALQVILPVVRQEPHDE